MGEMHAVVGELNLTYEFSPFASSGEWSFHPLAELGGAIWSNEEDTLGTVFGGGGLIMYMPGGEFHRPYLSATVGLAALSQEDFDRNDLGGYVQFRERVALGVRLGETMRHRLEIAVSHFSNAGLYSDNDGYNTLGIAYGYSF